MQNPHHYNVHACVYIYSIGSLCVCLFDIRSIEQHTLHLNRILVLFNYIPCT